MSTTKEAKIQCAVPSDGGVGKINLSVQGASYLMG